MSGLVLMSGPVPIVVMTTEESKALASISKPSGTKTVVRGVPSKAPSPIDVTLAGISTVVS